MDKQEIRDRVWDDLQESGEARFPYPPHGRIPNFAGADEAAERACDLEVWAAAETIKANPDAPQLPVRRAALRQGKTVYVAVPRLREAKCFLRLDPAAIDDVDHATTVRGAAEAGVNVGPEELPSVDLVVSGSVAVSEGGVRIGKGEGYSDLEFAVLREFGRVDDDTATLTTVHDRQVLADAPPASSHDVPMDYVVTPTRTLAPPNREKPKGVDWNELSEERLSEIPVLDALSR